MLKSNLGPLGTIKMFVNLYEYTVLITDFIGWSMEQERYDGQERLMRQRS